jgi:hypothetical protein
MTVKICLCAQCRATKRKMRTSEKRKIKKLFNKRRRRLDVEKVSNHYYS